MVRLFVLLWMGLGSSLALAQPAAPEFKPHDPQVVRDVQLGLYNLDYQPGPIDGISGPLTRAAVREFQAASGLAVTGRIDVGLWRQLRGAIHSGPWGAYAATPGGQRSGVAVLRQKRAAAEAEALKECGAENCRVRAFTGCLAQPAGVRFGAFGFGPDQATARRNGLLHCAADSQPCAIELLVCADGSEGPD